MSDWAAKYEEAKRKRLAKEQGTKNKNLGFSTAKGPGEVDDDDDLSDLLDQIPEEVIEETIKPDPLPAPTTVKTEPESPICAKALVKTEPESPICDVPIIPANIKSEIKTEPYSVEPSVNAEKYSVSLKPDPDAPPNPANLKPDPEAQPSPAINSLVKSDSEKEKPSAKRPLFTGMKNMKTASNRPSQKQDPNDPWFQAYEARKAAALENLKSKNLQSVAGASAFCGKIEGVSGLTAQNQVTKLMKKLKKEEKAPKLKFIDKNEPKAIGAVAKESENPAPGKPPSLFSNLSSGTKPPGLFSNYGSNKPPNPPGLFSNLASGNKPPNPPSFGQNNQPSYSYTGQNNSRSNNFGQNDGGQNNNSNNVGQNSANYRQNQANSQSFGQNTQNSGGFGKGNSGGFGKGNSGNYAQNQQNKYANYGSTNIQAPASKSYGQKSYQAQATSQESEGSAFRSRPPPPPSALLGSSWDKPSSEIPRGNAPQPTNFTSPESRPGRPSVPTPGRYGTKYGGAPSPGPNPSQAFKSQGFVPPTPPHAKQPFNNTRPPPLMGSNNGQRNQSNAPNTWSNGATNRFSGPNNQSNGSTNRFSGPNNQSSGSNSRFSGPNNQSNGSNNPFSGPNNQFNGSNNRLNGPRAPYVPPVKQSSGPTHQFSQSRPSGANPGAGGPGGAKKDKVSFMQSLRDVKVDSKKDSDSWQNEYEARKRARLEGKH